jgi:hypothetical protein
MVNADIKVENLNFFSILKLNFDLIIYYFN